MLSQFASHVLPFVFLLRFTQIVAPDLGELLLGDLQHGLAAKKIFTYAKGEVGALCGEIKNLPCSSPQNAERSIQRCGRREKEERVRI